MKIQLCSDLHLEFSDINITNEDNADVLILSGDIMIAQDLHEHHAADFNPYSSGALADLSRKLQRVARFRNFLERCSVQFPHVVYVMGNHEFYHGKFYASIDHMREEVAKFDNIYLLENDTKVINDVVFVGATLWTNMNKHDPMTMHAVKDMMNDFRTIRNDRREYAAMSPRDVVLRHTHTLDYFRARLSEHKDKKCVVVGHHSPSFKSVHESRRSQILMNGAYHSDLSEFILDHPQIALWTHGHTHHPFDYVIGETRVVCNPRGYEGDGYSEDTGWNPNLILEI
jgi:predicted phosphodiesterase